MKKILIMGLPGAGKTHLAERLQKHLNAAWFNADRMREMANDWEFSTEARQRQSMRMRNIADFELNQGRWVICDFVCPTEITRQLFKPGITIWIDTIKEGRFENTNNVFEKPLEADYHITNYLSDQEIQTLAEEILSKK